jgi:ActR/RegA family two-component response regulator
MTGTGAQGRAADRQRGPGVAAGPDAILARAPTDEVRILVVDDDQALSALVRARLERAAGHVVTGEARDLDTCLEIAETEQPDVVLVDLVLGSDRGADAVGPLSRLAPNDMIGLLTGLCADVEEVDLQRSGAFALYSKTRLDGLADRLRDDLSLFRRALNGEDVVAPSARVPTPSWAVRIRTALTPSWCATPATGAAPDALRAG